MTARLPIVGGDDGDWGTILNNFLEVSLTSTGTLNPSAVTAAGAAPLASPTFTGAVTVPNATTASEAAAYGQIPVAGTTTGTYAAGNDSRITNAADSQAAQAFPTTSGVISLICSEAYVWYGTVTGNFSLNLTNLPSAGTVAEVLVKVTQDSSGSHSFTGWSVNGSAVTPTYDTGVALVVNPTANTSTVMNVMTMDGGATLLGQGTEVVIDTIAGDYQPVGASTTAGSTGKAADAGHTHLGVSQLAVGSNVNLTGGDGSGHGALTVSVTRITKRVGSVASSATPTIDTDNYDIYEITALAVNITSFTTGLTGTPNDGDTFIIRITDNGTARSIAWGASFESSTVTLPTTTFASTLLTVGFAWNTVTSKWRCLGAV